MLAVGHADVSPAHDRILPAAAARSATMTIRVRGHRKRQPTCAPAKKVLHTYLRSHAPLQRVGCQWPSVSPHWRPSRLPTGGHLFSAVAASGIPHRSAEVGPAGEVLIDLRSCE